jgi:hypothetical protein
MLSDPKTFGWDFFGAHGRRAGAIVALPANRRSLILLPDQVSAVALYVDSQSPGRGSMRSTFCDEKMKEMKSEGGRQYA